MSACVCACACRACDYSATECKCCEANAKSRIRNTSVVEVAMECVEHGEKLKSVLRLESDVSSPVLYHTFCDASFTTLTSTDCQTKRESRIARDSS